jgi:predicted methyltransferase
LKSLLFICLMLSLFSCAHGKKDRQGLYSTKKLTKIVDGEHRSQENRDRNVYRNPVETLRFFEVEPHMTVVEISPGRGWYSEILGPYLKKKGKLYLATFSPNSTNEYRQSMAKDLMTYLEDNKNNFGDVQMTTFELPEVPGPIAPDGTADRVLTFRNVHGYLRAGQEKVAFESFFQALKPGGILGVVTHREKASRRQDPKVVSGYVREDLVIQIAEAAGFEFVSKSEVNANYLDTADHPDGVWSLPPGLRGQDKDRAKYLAIGESDRMTLKFRKPL